MKLNWPLQIQRRRPIQRQRQQRPPKKKERAAATNAAATSTTTSRRDAGATTATATAQADIVLSWGAALRSRAAGSQDESRCSAIHKQRPYRAIWVFSIWGSFDLSASFFSGGNLLL